tara:strand:- start:1024 stop:1305 length:282 start_codon:yes stop_codon:yes gene_type:complete
MILQKLNEWLIVAVGIIGGITGFTIKRLHRSVDKAHSRITSLEKLLVDRPFLESQLAPIRQDLNLILSHLLEHRKTEGQPKAHLKPPPSHPKD